MVAPVAHDTGMYANPWAMFVESVSSRKGTMSMRLRNSSELHTAHHALHHTRISVQHTYQTPAISRSATYAEGVKRSHLITRVKNVFDKPKQTMEMASPPTPTSKTGLRPMWSESRDHWNTNIASVAKKIDSYKQQHDVSARGSRWTEMCTATHSQ